MRRFDHTIDYLDVGLEERLRRKNFISGIQPREREQRIEIVDGNNRAVAYVYRRPDNGFSVALTMLDKNDFHPLALMDSQVNGRQFVRDIGSCFGAHGERLFKLWPESEVVYGIPFHQVRGGMGNRSYLPLLVRGDAADNREELAQMVEWMEMASETIALDLGANWKAISRS